MMAFNIKKQAVAFLTQSIYAFWGDQPSLDMSLVHLNA